MRTILLAALLGLAGATLAADDTPSAKTLRVLCYNIHHAEGTDRKLDLPRIAAVIKAAKPDLVALQEVDNNTLRTKKVDQAAELAKLTGMHFAFARAIDLQGGQYGLAILSRYPLKRVKSHKLPGKPKQEARIVMEATVEPKGLPALTFLNTHLQHDDAPTRLQQAARISEIYERAKGPILLAGDLNAAPGSAPIQALAKSWAFATVPGGKGLLTIPSDTPRSQIDYIAFRPARSFRVAEARALPEKVASDHRPVLAVLEWAGK